LKWIQICVLILFEVRLSNVFHVYLVKTLDCCCDGQFDAPATLASTEKFPGTYGIDGLFGYGASRDVLEKNVLPIQRIEPHFLRYNQSAVCLYRSGRNCSVIPTKL
jgi:hypothetical protein